MTMKKQSEPVEQNHEDRLELIKKAAEARPFNLIERMQTWMFGDCDFDERYQDD